MRNVLAIFFLAQKKALINRLMLSYIHHYYNVCINFLNIYDASLWVGLYTASPRYAAGFPLQSLAQTFSTNIYIELDVRIILINSILVIIYIIWIINIAWIIVIISFWGGIIRI